MPEINWIKLDKPPVEEFGWFVVSVVPRNYSSNNKGIVSDNEWIKSFGFTKAWLNNGDFWEPSHHEYQSRCITEYVTHYSKCPNTPLLESPHTPFQKKAWNMYDRPSEEKLSELAKTVWENIQKDSGKEINPYAFIKGFISAFAYMGIK